MSSCSSLNGCAPLSRRATSTPATVSVVRRGRTSAGPVLSMPRPYHDFAGAVDGQIVQRLLRA